jgi:hypothetical protein
LAIEESLLCGFVEHIERARNLRKVIAIFYGHSDDAQPLHNTEPM